MNIQKFLLLTLLTIFTSKLNAQKVDRINSACELVNRVGETLIVVGKYDRCMEYSGFQTIKRDTCSANFQMELKNIPSNTKLTSNFKKLLNYGCGGYFKLVIKGKMRKDSKTGHGHLGTNDVEFIVEEILKIGKVKYSKFK